MKQAVDSQKVQMARPLPTLSNRVAWRRVKKRQNTGTRKGDTRNAEASGKSMNEFQLKSLSQPSLWRVLRWKLKEGKPSCAFQISTGACMPMAMAAAR